MPEMTSEMMAFMKREYSEIVMALNQAVLPIYQRHASTEPHMHGAVEAHELIMKAIQPALLESASRYGKLGQQYAELNRYVDGIREDRETYRRAWNRSDEQAALLTAKVEEEREACANIADKYCEAYATEGKPGPALIAKRMADEIRSRPSPSLPAGGQS